VAFRPNNGLRKPGSVTPGLHRPEAGEHDVVWWDPSVLDLNRQDEIGARLNQLLAADEEGKRSEQGIHDHSAWKDNRTRVRDQAGAPSVRVVTTTEHAKDTAQRGEHSAKGKEQGATSREPGQPATQVGQLDLLPLHCRPERRST